MLTARHVEGGRRCQRASESDQRACYKFIHALWSLCYQANYITAKCLVNQGGGKRCPQLKRVPGFISLHISQCRITEGAVQLLNDLLIISPQLEVSDVSIWCYL